MSLATHIPPSARNGLAAAAIGLAAFFIAGIVADVRGFDPTRGGYEPPYTNYTGNPIDWSSVETTRTGMRKAGYVIDVTVDCTSGMMSFEVLGLTFPFRTFSERALVVHRPREACTERGFNPRF